jgi:hypothetical protein
MYSIRLEEARVCGSLFLVFLLAACGGGGGGGTTQPAVAPGANGQNPGVISGNSAPSIFGTPATSVAAGAAYEFTPAATDPDFDTLSYAILNKPQWASFSTVTGRLSGNPDDTAVGTTSNVVISVSDGSASAALPAFAVTVTAAGSSRGGLPIAETEPASYEWSILQSGEKVFIDRDLTFGDIPNAYEGLDFLRTANDDKFVSSTAAISFAVAQPVTVYVAYDSRIPVLPSWLSDWVDTGDEWRGTGVQTDVYRRDFPAGRIDLGGNEMGFNMYSLAVGPQGGATPPPVQPPSPPATQPPSPNNAPPAIGGTPAAVVDANSSYSFVPSASDPDGDRLTFGISNKPGWATFNTGTGRLAGTPGDADVGFSGTILIAVTDGQQFNALPTFTITIRPSSSPPSPPPPTAGSATLTWSAPTQDAAGAQLRDLAGFRVYYSRTLGSYGTPRTISNPGVTSFTIDNLSAGTWYFVVTAYDTSGNESVYSNTASKTIVTP